MYERIDDITERNDVEESELTRRDLVVKGSALGISLTTLGGLFGTFAREGFGAASAVSQLRGKKFIVLALGLQFEFQVGLYRTLEKLLKAKGASVKLVDGKADASLQATQAENAIVQQPDILILNPADPKLLAPSVAKANRAKIPVFIFENPPPTGWVALVTFGDQLAGRLGADTLAKLINPRAPVQAKGLVLECRGGIGSTQAALRFKGFHDRVKQKYPGLKIKTLRTEWTADRAFTLVSNALTVNPDVAGVWSHNDEMVKGVVSAFQKLGKLKPPRHAEHIPIVGLDATPLALDRIRKGTQDASMGQNPFEMAGLMVKVVEQYLQDKTVPKKSLVRPQVVTRKNVNDRKLWGNVFGK